MSFKPFYSFLQESSLSFLLASVLLVSNSAYSLANDNDSALIDQFIQAQDYSSAIVFDSNNIKQFWIDNSVASINNTINISLPFNDSKERMSAPLKIQLANVKSNYICRVDMIGKSQDYHFTVTNSASQTISSSSNESDFIQNSVKTASFSLEDTPDNTFYINFSSTSQTSLSINKILLSFSEDKNRTFTYFNESNLTLVKSHCLSEDADDAVISVAGKESEIVPSEKTRVSNQLFKSSAIIKNVGDTPARVYFGYVAYLEDGTKLNGMYYPYDKTILKVVSHEKGSNTIIVSPFPQNGSINNRIARNVKDDLSDVPNKSFVSNRVIEIKKMDNDQGEIKLEKPLDTALSEGEKIRLHSSPSGYLYSMIKVLNPGEEAVFVSSIKKDDNNISYSSRSLPKGTFYVTPVILSFSVNSNSENTVLIKNFSFSH